MPRLAQNVGGGFLTGFGRGLELQGREKRAAALKALERDQQLNRDQSREAAADRRQTERLTAADKRQERSDKAAKSRLDLRLTTEAKTRRGLLKGTFQSADGTHYSITNSGITKSTGIKGARPGEKGKKAPPADVGTADWLARHQAAAEGREPTSQDFVDAFDRVKQVKDNPARRGGLAVRVYDSMKRDIRDRRTDPEKRKAAEAWVDQLMKEPDKPLKAGPGAGGIPRVSPPPVGGSGAEKAQAPKSFKSSSDVRAAFRNGDITREQAEKILKQKFGFQ